MVAIYGKTDRETLRARRVMSQSAARARLEAAWAFFVRGVKRQLKLAAPKAAASVWLASKKNSLPKICGYYQTDIMAKFGIGASTVRRMRVTLIMLLRVGEEHIPPTPHRQTFAQFKTWALAEKRTREPFARDRHANAPHLTRMTPTTDQAERPSVSMSSLRYTLRPAIVLAD